MLWEDEAKQFGADIERVQVWDAISEFFLDSSPREEHIAQILARSPFSLAELKYIEHTLGAESRQVLCQ